jgi:hypothetical protein
MDFYHLLNLVFVNGTFSACVIDTIQAIFTRKNVMWFICIKNIGNDI